MVITEVRDKTALYLVIHQAERTMRRHQLGLRDLTPVIQSQSISKLS